MANKYIIVGSTPFRQGFNGELLRCLIDDKAYKVIGEAHYGAYGGHVNGPMLVKKILQQDYYWPTMEEDYVKFVRRCEKVSTSCRQNSCTCIFSPSTILTMAIFYVGI